MFACLALVFVVGIASLQTNAAIRQSPLTTIAVCDSDEYATLTSEGVVCKAPTDTWTNTCGRGSSCCDSGEFLKITPTGLSCFPFSNKETTYTADCANCCGAHEFAVITTLGLRCAGGGVTKTPIVKAQTLSATQP